MVGMNKATFIFMHQPGANYILGMLNIIELRMFCPPIHCNYSKRFELVMHREKRPENKHLCLLHFYM